MHQINYFAEAKTYNLFKLQELQSVRESSPQYSGRFRWSERHLQCIWFDDHLRPDKLKLASGENISVISPGRWNLEAGPDFLDTVLKIGPGERIIKGDVELHIYPSDWDHHKHAGNPAYDNVILHVTWANSPASKELTPGVQCLSLIQPMKNRPWFSMDDIDLKAYPHNILPETPRPCTAYLFNNPDYTQALLSTAGYHRMQNKALTIARQLEDSADREQVFYGEFMAALGYKQNKLSFRAMANHITLPRLRECASREEGLALLLGAAGLLPEPDAVKTVESATFVRALWDIWWKSGMEQISSDILWTLHSLRPNNHPTRRIAAAASLFQSDTSLLRQIDNLSSTISGKIWIKQVTELITEVCGWPYWNQQLLFNSKPDQDKSYALLGNRRINAILTNVIIPFYAAEKRLPIDTFNHLPPEDISSPMRTAAWYLLGRDHNPVLYSGNNLLQQGMLQIYLDFCLPAKSGCQGCKLYKKIVKDIGSKSGD